MPRTEARVFTSIWKDEDFIALPPTAQRLYVFLISQPDLTYCGAMPLRERRWVSKAAGLTLADIERDLKELEGYPKGQANPGLRQPFIITDPDTGELLVRALIRRDSAWKQPNLLKLAIESAQEIESVKIRCALLTEVLRLPVDDSPSAQVRTLVEQFIQDLRQGLPDPSDNPDGDPDPNHDDNPDGEGTDEARARAHLLRTPLSDPPTDLSARDRKLGTRLPDDFAVTAEMVAWVRENAPHVDGKRETDRFCDYWHAKPGKDGRKLDWVRTWRNWMRTAEDRQGPRDRPGRREAEQQETEDLFGRNLAREASLGTPMGELQ